MVESPFELYIKVRDQSGVMLFLHSFSELRAPEPRCESIPGILWSYDFGDDASIGLLRISKQNRGEEKREEEMASTLHGDSSHLDRIREKNAQRFDLKGSINFAETRIALTSSGGKLMAILKWPHDFHENAYQPRCSYDKPRAIMTLIDEGTNGRKNKHQKRKPRAIGDRVVDPPGSVDHSELFQNAQSAVIVKAPSTALRSVGLW